MRLNFNPETHTYTTEQGIVVDSVTTILRDEGYISFKGIHPEVLRAARELGTNVHIACDLYIKNDLDESSLSAPLVPYLEAFKKVLKDTNAQVLDSEQIVYSPLWGFCGRYDLHLFIRKAGIWDIKTGTSVHPATALQLAGYEIAAKEQGIECRERGSIQLLPDATYRLHTYKDRSDIDLFKSIVASHNGRKKYIKGEFDGIDSY